MVRVYKTGFKNLGNLVGCTWIFVLEIVAIHQSIDPSAKCVLFFSVFDT